MSDFDTSHLDKARKALQGVHRVHLHWAMHTGDEDYATTMNAMFRLLDRLAEPEESA